MEATPAVINVDLPPSAIYPITGSRRLPGCHLCPASFPVSAGRLAKAVTCECARERVQPHPHLAHHLLSLGRYCTAISPSQLQASGFCVWGTRGTLQLEEKDKGICQPGDKWSQRWVEPKHPPGAAQDKTTRHLKGTFSFCGCPGRSHPKRGSNCVCQRLLHRVLISSWDSLLLEPKKKFENHLDCMELLMPWSLWGRKEDFQVMCIAAVAMGC